MGLVHLNYLPQSHTSPQRPILLESILVWYRDTRAQDRYRTAYGYQLKFLRKACAISRTTPLPVAPTFPLFEPSHRIEISQHCFI